MCECMCLMWCAGGMCAIWVVWDGCVNIFDGCGVGVCCVCGMGDVTGWALLI